MAISRSFFVFFSASIAALLSVALLPNLNSTKWGAVLRLSREVADLVVTNAVIYTSDSGMPFAEAMAVKDGRILRVGNRSSVQDLHGHGTKVLNVEGKIVVPGFIDSHVHLLWGGLQMDRVVLRGVKSKEDFIKMLKEAVREKAEGFWILGGGWNNELWGGDLPVASWIDDITTENPVWLSRMDGHMGLANSLALKIAGITKDTKDPAGGSIVRTPLGDPTGLLVDSAMNLLLRAIPEVSVNEKRDALVRASKLALTKGVTTVVDIGRYIPGARVEDVWDDFTDVYEWAESKGQMLIRDLIHRTGRVIGHWIYLGGVKAFADGSLGSNSALFYEPYLDELDYFGLQVTETDSLYNMTMASDKAGLQVAIHAIGDRANDLILDLYESVATSNGNRDRRFRIEHAQHLAPGAAARFGQLRIIASVQPEHLLDDAEYVAKKLGVKRAETESYLFQSLLANNAQIAFGSDWPVANINPLGGIRTAMKRMPPARKTSWIPSECVSLDDALKAYTISAAHASFLDNELGSLFPGKLADFVVLSITSWEEFAAEGSASINATYINGLQAYPWQPETSEGQHSQGNE